MRSYKRWVMPALLLAVLLSFGCKKEGRVDYIDPNIPAPRQISDIKTVATPGGAIVTYKIPNDPNFYYAKAVYEIQPGVFREAKSSIYNDTLKLEGFGDTLVHDVQIFSVGRNEKQSEPTTFQVQPLTPAFRIAFKTLGIVSTFGGVQVDFKNPSMDNLAIVVLRDTTGLKTWSTLSTFHTGADSGRFSIRGLDSIPQRFAVYIRDRWGNMSDTLRADLKPIYEQLIPKNTWRAYVLPGDQTEIADVIYPLEYIWDGRYPQLTTGSYASSNNSRLPQWFTIDMGRKAIISRIAEHQSDASFHFYDGSALKTVEIWGSNNPAPDGSWASWDSLGTFHSFKPSGLPMGQFTAEDVQYGQIQGENFEFDHLLPPYRFIRWKTVETYASPGQVVISEIDFYGQLVD